MRIGWLKIRLKELTKNPVVVPPVEVTFIAKVSAKLSGGNTLYDSGVAHRDSASLSQRREPVLAHATLSH